MCQTRYPSKSLVFKSHFSSKVRQHGKQQLYLMLDSLQNSRCSFIFTTLLVLHTTTLKSPLKICSSTSVNFYLHIPPLIVHKIILTISTNTPFLYTSAIFHTLFLRITIPTIYTKNIIPASAI